MAISFIDSNVQDLAGGQSLTFTIPAGAQADDLILVCVKQSENTAQQFWDDDGGGGRGYIRLAYNRSTSGRDQETAIYYKIHSGSETNPTFTWNTGGTNEQMSGSMLIYRGVDATTPITADVYSFYQNDPSPPIPTINVQVANSWVVAFQAVTHDDITAVAPPTGFTLRTQVWAGTSNDHRNHFTADIDRGASTGNYTPPDWQHSHSNNTPESHSYAVVLQELQPIGVTNAPSVTDYGNNITIDGYNFEAVQGTGKLELWSDQSGTIKTVQVITSWGDTSIDFDVTQGSLPNDAVVYLVVTNDAGDVSTPRAINVGVTPYDVIIANQSPDHWWTLSDTTDGQNGYADTGFFGTTSNLTNIQDGAGGAIVATQICDGTPNSWDLNGGRRECVNSNAINGTVTQNRLMGGWFVAQTVFQGLTCIYEEGGGVNNICFLIGLGNRLICSYADTGDDNAQAFSNFALEVGRPYHILFRFSHTDATKEFRMYIDGVLQDGAAGNPLTSGDLDGHGGDISFGGPGGNLEVAGTDVLFQDTFGGNYAQWVTWSTSRSQAQITELFERGALPDFTLSGTAANMQTQLDTIADTVRRNWPLAIRVQKPSDATNLSLSADNITFNPLCTIYLEWRGSGTLTWTNLNGSDLVSEKVFATTGGTVNIVNPAVLTLTNLQLNTEVRVYEQGTTTELGGVENSGTSFNLSVQTAAVDISIISEQYQNLRLLNVATIADTTLPIQQRFDRVYENP